ncbi:MAG: ribosome maturation factor RimP [Legionella sp.]
MVQQEIEQLVKPTIESMGYILWGCEYLAQGKHSLLRIYIDKEDGVGIDDCQRVSQQVSALLDVEDPIASNYSLEISSPGMPRPLLKSEHYQQYIGYVVHVKLYKAVASKRKFEGTILSASEDKLTLMIGNEQQEFMFSNIVKANLAV